MRAIVMISAAAILLPSPAWAQDEQFNLRCTGIMTSIVNSNETKQPYEKVLRIDLAGGRWCEGSCGFVNDIKEVQPTQLLLAEGGRESAGERSFFSHSINRTTRQQTITSETTLLDFGMSTVTQHDGQCEVEPFTGFPEDGEGS